MTISNKKTKKSTKIQPKIIKGWNTTDLDEIERRKIRGQTESLLLQLLSEEFNYFGDFLVHSKLGGTKYLVEIRSLTERINSCECLDYLGNSLGTCKHIEYVLFKLVNKKNCKRKYKKAAINGSPNIEIYIDFTQNNFLRIYWPKGYNQNKSATQKLSKFFNKDGWLKVELLTFYNKLSTIICGIKFPIRVSKGVDYIVARQQALLQKQAWQQQVLTKFNSNNNLINLKLPLYPYQQKGMLHLALNERALLADDMGLGKTVQAVAACELLLQFNKITKVLVITTASLKAEWLEQISKFTNKTCVIIQGLRGERLKQYQTKAVFYLANYEQIVADREWLQHVLAPEVIILDEAQRIKNWQTKTANFIKKLSSHYAFVLTGTPLENKIDDLYSIVQFLDPHLFGPLFKFNRDFYQLDQTGKAVGYKNLDQLHIRLQPIMLRRLKQDIETQLPTRSNKNYLVAMEIEQQIRYEEYEKKVKILLAKIKNRHLRKEEYQELQRYLACMRMICDTPYILDQDCKISPKIQELANILEDLLIDPKTKIIIFSEWARMLELVKELLITKEIAFAWHTGALNPIKRRQEINKFKTIPEYRLLLSTDAGSVGLNLQVASVVINLDLPWNPAKLEQRIARAWRKNQTNSVRVINFVCEDSIEERMLSMLSQKQSLASNALDGATTLTAMPMPSSKKSLVDNITKLMAKADDEPLLSIAPAKSAQPKNIQQEQNYLVQKMLTLAKNTDKRIIAVVDDQPNQTISLLKQEIIKRKIANRIEVIDQSTFKLLKHLEQQGILSVNSEFQLLMNIKEPALVQ